MEDIDSDIQSMDGEYSEQDDWHIEETEKKISGIRKYSTNMLIHHHYVHIVNLGGSTLEKIQKIKF